MKISAGLLLAMLILGGGGARGATVEELFRQGDAAYREAEYAEAAKAFRESAEQQPASGTFQNLGNAEWNRGRVGVAILAWEQALWLDPADARARNNLRLARDTAQVEAPELRWYEAGSAWLSAAAWAWITTLSLWLVAGMLTLPPALRWPRAGWHQALAALGLTAFMLCVPAQLGLHTRSRIGFILQRDTPLRLTPTTEAQAVTRLAEGEPARWQRVRGNYFFVRTSHAAGWVERERFGLVCPE